jgi:DNA-binding transcriptional MerR regulator
MSAPAQELLKISELSEQSGVPVATIHHYLREGLLPEPVKTSRNMAYYPPEFVERLRVIKQLQEERFMPLKVIRELLDRGDADPDRLRAMIEMEDRILSSALEGRSVRATSNAMPTASAARIPGVSVTSMRLRPCRSTIRASGLNPSVMSGGLRLKSASVQVDASPQALPDLESFDMPRRHV